jgi:acetyl esterase/lipase
MLISAPSAVHVLHRASIRLAFMGQACLSRYAHCTTSSFSRETAHSNGLDSTLEHAVQAYWPNCPILASYSGSTNNSFQDRFIRVSMGYPLELVFKQVGGLDLKLDVYLPRDASSEKPAPVCIWWHGGGCKSSYLPCENRV